MRSNKNINSIFNKQDHKVSVLEDPYIAPEIIYKVF